VYAVATFRLGTAFHLEVFGTIGTLLTLVLVATWVLVAVRTVAGAWDGRLFHSPCIASASS
jgi:tellurite resistance protein TehA-like permease